MQLKPHSRLQNGKYEIIRELGQGGFGITYLAVLEGHDSYSGIINVTSNTDQMNLERLLTVPAHKKPRD